MTLNLATRTVTRARERMTLDAEVCVVGGGAAGIMAALTAASLGRKTVLLDAMPTIGGQLVGTLLGTICGLYSNGPRPYRVTFGAVDDMLNELHGAGAIHARRALDTIVLQYDEMLCGRWSERALSRANVDLVLGAVLRSARVEGRRIVELDVSTRWGDLAVRADGFIDASGDAAIAWHAGLPVREPHEPQWGTQMILLEGFAEDAIADFDGFHVAEVLKHKKREYGLSREDGFIFAFPGRGVATVNMTHMPNPTEPIAATRATLEGRDQADKVLEFLRREFPRSMGQARIRAYGLPGIRQTRWFVGAHQLTIDEVRAGHRPADAVARCSWPVEAHDSAETVHWETFEDRNHMHYVPLRSLVHRDSDNLIAAGRCIDGDVAALASVRVMGPCFAMGQAAAHALDISGGKSLHDVDSSRLANRLRDNLDGAKIDRWCNGV
ncbi:FAD-dependent oxidoreductase [Bradyrhizobium sp. WBOS7]|uniref:FAD-dependent oxidoreductase n=2 Tax=Nitrobacteraceae TaxID=41294 RepID=A0AAE9N9Y9_9BRAD|nr:FAD-dependent oxidoreductase [Bradyrhizobium sp. WBOS2]MDD1570630.1 FAD-dependent oxidoreductase [Bradyrhizobium sp. WBOS1]MDD1578388.1 FAD-dependent oxidoreductase [Bradyrhizobium sp. WBOS7]MDD1601111.1 FAD-dependent oxidoreductase [Bradyrhizobium sp. WBOS16]UUO34908.1 FAD-dependent oxidoreductase [Bradyrhizobium sp. WBOS01]UUO41236.1 FAD-dependent oxidoreductase [Bradyrhizobium sp. WBOS02]UUO55553.1 FAD-dependent oxidoreductase [Bradyrhizobium sp. WBOS07]UUO65605.1 FAD-dependent oxidore